MKPKEYISLILFLTIEIFFSACEENVALEYEDDPALYFAYEDYGQKDSISQSFFVIHSSQLRDTVYVKVNTMGNLKDFDRPIKLIQTNEGEANAAVAGVHFVAFDSEELAGKIFVAAGANYVNVPVILLRDPSLELSEYRLALSIDKNEYFRPGINTLTHFVVKTSSLAVKPSTWDKYWRYQFGASWGSVKMRFIIDATGVTEWEILPSDLSYGTFLGAQVKAKFEQYNKEHPNNPLKEADGTLVSFTS